MRKSGMFSNVFKIEILGIVFARRIWAFVKKTLKNASLFFLMNCFCSKKILYFLSYTLNQKGGIVYGNE
jgi:hypothetical protein